jgi:hypothetical protein
VSDAPSGATPSASPGLSNRATWVILAVVFVVLAGVVGLIVWAVSSSGSASAPRPGFERFEPAWQSAMAKASVEATFPAGPVDLTQVRATGSQPFEATFTAEEISALVSVYRFEMTVSGEKVALGDAEIGFPEDGIGELDAELYARGSRYRAKATAPVTYVDGEITSPGLSSLRVEGFSVGGNNREMASEGIFLYLNRYLAAAPGLVVEEARIVEGGLVVTGTAPERLEHPEPLEP